MVLSIVCVEINWWWRMRTEIINRLSWTGWWFANRWDITKQMYKYVTAVTCRDRWWLISPTVCSLLSVECDLWGRTHAAHRYSILCQTLYRVNVTIWRSSISHPKCYIWILYSNVRPWHNPLASVSRAVTTYAVYGTFKSNPDLNFSTWFRKVFFIRERLTAKTASRLWITEQTSGHQAVR